MTLIPLSITAWRNSLTAQRVLRGTKMRPASAQAYISCSAREGNKGRLCQAGPCVTPALDSCASDECWCARKQRAETKTTPAKLTYGAKSTATLLLYVLDFYGVTVLAGWKKSGHRYICRLVGGRVVRNKSSHAIHCMLACCTAVWASNFVRYVDDPHCWVFPCNAQ